MKKLIFKPITAMAVVALTMFGCASSENTKNGSAIEGTNRSGGMTVEPHMDYKIVADASHLYDAWIGKANDPVEYNDMFENIDTDDFNTMALLRKSPNHTVLVNLLERANLVSDLDRVGEFTLFAPTNKAFAKVDRQKMEELLKPNNIPMLSRVLQVHVLPNKAFSNQFTENTRISLTENRYIPISTTLGGTVVTVGGAQIIRPNIESSNGVIHVVDNVILPSQVAMEK